MRKDLYKELFEVENKHWWHDHKRKVIHQMIDKYANQGKVLDIGAGMGKILKELQIRDWQVYGVDSENQAVRWSQKRGIKIKRRDIEKDLGFKSNSFDLVLALDVIEHLKDDQEMLNKIADVLKKQGVAIITVPAYQWLFNYWDEMLGHKRRYTTQSLKNIISADKFEIEYLGYFSMFIFPVAMIVRIIKKIFGTTETSDFQTTPWPWISVPVIKFFNYIERMLLSVISLPFGLSVICVIRKKYQ
ncbi:class I SAM-dependent methyltransferase [Patescibacteria group bacterium]